MTKILIFGTGAVGSIYASILHRAGVSVTVVCRSNYDAIISSGITVVSPKWGTFSIRPTSVVRSVGEAVAHGPFDYVLVCSKAYAGTHALIREAVSPETAIVLAQNGIGIEEDYAKAYPQNVIISGIVWMPATQNEPGVVVHPYELERFEVGTYPANADADAKSKVEQLCDLFAKGGATAIHCPDVQKQRWAKIAINASMNPVCALTVCDDTNFLRSSTHAMRLVKDVQAEVARVAAAAGYGDSSSSSVMDDDDAFEERMRIYTDRLHRSGKEPSMLVDVKSSRSMEVDAILGNLVKLAERYEVDTPLLRMLFVLATARNFANVRREGWIDVGT